MVSFYFVRFSCRLTAIVTTCRVSAGGSCASRLVGKATVASNLKSITPQQLGEEEVLDEDVAREVERVSRGGGDGNEDAVKVTRVFVHYCAHAGVCVSVCDN